MTLGLWCSGVWTTVRSLLLHLQIWRREWKEQQLFPPHVPVCFAAACLATRRAGGRSLLYAALVQHLSVTNAAAGGRSSSVSVKFIKHCRFVICPVERWDLLQRGFLGKTIEYKDMSRGRNFQNLKHYLFFGLYLLRKV